jgi:hypothetical protein
MSTRYAISLTTIPPRFDRLTPVIASLLAQDPAPERVYLSLPNRYRRFEGNYTAPDLPAAVEILRPPDDLGPATKALIAAGRLAGELDALIYCDDDWIMPPNWAATLLAARQPERAVTGAGFSVSRLNRQGAAPDFTDIAQGFAGVLIDPKWLSGAEYEPPDIAWPVDDIWLSGHLARQNIPIIIASGARAGMRLAYHDAHGLQDADIGGQTRDQANRACASLMHARFGIWPELSNKANAIRDQSSP